jgi:hypothetical protein
MPAYLINAEVYPQKENRKTEYNHYRSIKNLVSCSEVSGETVRLNKTTSKTMGTTEKKESLSLLTSPFKYRSPPSYPLYSAGAGCLFAQKRVFVDGLSSFGRGQSS